jgi:hypothetical protein
MMVEGLLTLSKARLDKQRSSKQPVLGGERLLAFSLAPHTTDDTIPERRRGWDSML